MDDLGLNKYLEETYGRTIDGKVLFRIVWSTGLTERRKSRFIDYNDQTVIREVTEERECLKYPFAQDRWVLERIHLIPKHVRQELLINEMYTYEEVYIFQDKQMKFLPLNKEALEFAMFLFFRFYLQMTPKDRVNMRIEMLAKRDLLKKQQIRESLGEGQSPFGFVLEGIKR